MNTTQKTFNVWIGTEPRPEDRLRLLVSTSDRNIIDSLPSGKSDRTATVTDLHTGQEYTVRRAPCGLNCYCALEIDTENQESH